ncbi:hypothetical protein [Nocardia sp. NBC_01388]|uniref:hypothetical protein n=1 Tax=Nocardia sp. NBC_01388 TaxID=2903596 RepID=UPI00324538A3
MVDTDSIVFGVAGFIGRSLVAELLRNGRTVAAAVRSGSRERLRTWLIDEGVDQGQLTIVDISPAFLPSRASRLTRSRIIAEVMKRLPAAKLAEQLGVPNSPAIESAAANLHRPGVACRTVAALAAASTPRNRTALTAELSQLRVPFDIIAGSDDPITAPITHPVTIIDGTGHYPQLTHPDVIASLLRSAGSRAAASEGAVTAVG